MAGAPWERISIELTVPHPPPKNSRGRYIFTVVDHFTKWAEACPLRNKEATIIACALGEHVLTRHGMPVQILSDQENEVDFFIMCETCRLYGVDKVRTTPYKPSTNAAVERFHRTLNSMLEKVMSICQRDWVERLPDVMAAYRASRHEATSFSPNLLVFGREIRAPIDLVSPMICRLRRGRILSSAKSGCTVRHTRWSVLISANNRFGGSSHMTCEYGQPRSW